MNSTSWFCGLNLLNLEDKLNCMNSNVPFDCSSWFESNRTELEGLNLTLSSVFFWDENKKEIVINVPEQIFGECIEYLPVQNIKNVKRIWNNFQGCFLERNCDSLIFFNDMLGPEKSICLPKCKDCKFGNVKSIGNVSTYAYVLDDNNIIHILKDFKANKPTITHFQMPEVITTISCGFEHCLFLSEMGSVYTTGNGSKGQLGSGTIDECTTIERLECLEPLKIKSISTGGWHSLVLSESGDIYSWGWNESGQLGHGDTIICFEPKLVDVDLDITFKTISCGTRHSAAISSSNHLWTWGWNAYGQLGHGDKVNRVSPTKLSHQDGFCVSLKCGPWSTIFTLKNS